MAETRNWEKAKHPDPKNTGPMVKAFLAWPNGYDRTKPETLSVNVNGYRYELKFGAENTAPREVWAAVKNCKSSVLTTPNISGERTRPQADIMQMPGTWSYVNDYEVVGEKEL